LYYSLIRAKPLSFYGQNYELIIIIISAFKEGPTDINAEALAGAGVSGATNCNPTFSKHENKVNQNRKSEKGDNKKTGV
jgi:hypothetical protein